MAEQIPGGLPSGQDAGQGADQWPTQTAGVAFGAWPAPDGTGPSYPPMPPMPPAPPAYPPSFAPVPTPVDAGADGYRLAPPQVGGDAEGYRLAPPLYPQLPQQPPVYPPYPPQQQQQQQQQPPAYPPNQSYQPPAPPKQSRGEGQSESQGRQRSERGRVFGIVAIATVLVAAASAAVVLVTDHQSPGGGKPPTRSATVAGRQLTPAWSVPADSGGDATTIGGWVTSKYAIRVDQDTVLAYSLATGKQAWQAAIPGSGNEHPCAMSPTLSANGTGTVGFGTTGAECNQLVGLDTATGKTLWTVSLTNNRTGLGTMAQTYIQGSVATLISPTVITGLNVSTGKTVWTYHQRGQFCDVYPTGATGAVLVSDFCAGTSPNYTLSELDPLTGKVEWSKAESGDVDFADVFTGDPVSATLEAGADAKPYVYDSHGDATPIAVPSKAANDPAPFDDSAPAQVVGHDLVFEGYQQAGGQNSTGGPIQAFDAATGEPAWTYSGQGGFGALLLAPTGNGTLYALSTGAIGGTPQLVRLDPATGKATVVGALPGDGQWNLDFDRLYLAPGGDLVELGSMTDPDVALFH